MAATVHIMIDLGATYAGLTLNGQLFDAAFANTGGVISTGFTALGNGFYGLVLSVADDFIGGLKVFEEGETDILTSLCFDVLPVQLDPAQVMPFENADNTLGDCLNGARVEAFGDKARSGNTFTKKNADGSTAKTFDLTPHGGPFTGETAA